MARELVRTLAGVSIFVLAVWAIGLAVGFEISLIPTLVGSVLLTLVINLITFGFRRQSPS